MCCFSTSNTKGKRIFRYDTPSYTSHFVLWNKITIQLNTEERMITMLSPVMQDCISRFVTSCFHKTE